MVLGSRWDDSVGRKSYQTRQKVLDISRPFRLCAPGDTLSTVPKAHAKSKGTALQNNQERLRLPGKRTPSCMRLAFRFEDYYFKLGTRASALSRGAPRTRIVRPVSQTRRRAGPESAIFQLACSTAYRRAGSDGRAQSPPGYSGPASVNCRYSTATRTPGCCRSNWSCR